MSIFKSNKKWGGVLRAGKNIVVILIRSNGDIMAPHDCKFPFLYSHSASSHQLVRWCISSSSYPGLLEIP